MNAQTRPKSGYVTSAGFKMHYLLWGRTGKPLVALHSMMMDAHGLDPFSRSMAKEWRVLAIDLLGHGDSDKPTEKVSLEEHTEVVRAVVNEMKFRPAALVGHSIGGIIGMVYAAKYPDEVSKLILVDIAPWDPAWPRTRPAIPTPESFDSGEAALAYFKQRFPRFTQQSYQNRLRYGLEKTPDDRLRLKTSLKTMDMLRQTNVDLDLRSYAQRIHAPTLLIKGSESPTVSPSSVEKMRRLLRGFKSVEVAGATHMIPQDKPDEFEEIVREFLR